MSDNYSVTEDFEKVDHDILQEQDENVTSTSMSAEMAEEDRYTGSGPPNDVDLLQDFLGGEASSEATASKPLINLDTPLQESVSETQPVLTETAASSDTPSNQAEGGWMKTVDPRDDLKEMEEPSPSNTGEASPVKSHELPTGQQVSGESSDLKDTFLVDKLDSESDSSSVISSSDNEYSSSADESDTESSDSQGSDIGNVAEKIDGFTEFDSGETVPLVNQTETENNDTEILIVRQNNQVVEHLSKAMEASEETQGRSVPVVSLETDYGTNNMSEMCLGEHLEKSCEARPMEETTNSAESPMHSERIRDISDGATMSSADDGVKLIGKNVGISEEDMLGIIDKLTRDEEADKQLTELESDFSVRSLDESRSARDPEFEMFVKGEEVSMDSTSPVVSDSDECDSVESKSTSSHSGPDFGSDISSGTDSDISGDEEVIGTWSPSPLYGESSGNFEDDCRDEGTVEEGEQGTDVLAGYKYSGVQGSNTDQFDEALQQETELKSLRADVQGLMEQMEAIVQDTENEDTQEPADFIKAVVTDIDNSVNGADVEEPVPEVISTSEQLTSIMATGARERSKTPEGELLHVKFQTPTNTLFYDPECPIVEKVSVEVADDLIDHDKDEEINDSEGLEVKVVEDLKEVFQNLEARGEIEGALDLLKETGITNMDDIALQFAQDVIEQARNERLAKEKSKQDIDLENETTANVEQFLSSQASIENSTQKEQTENDTKSQLYDISEEIIEPDRKAKVSFDPLEGCTEEVSAEPIGLHNDVPHNPSLFDDQTLSEQELITPGSARDTVYKNDEVCKVQVEERNHTGHEESLGEEPVYREKVLRVEADMPIRGEIDSMIIHDIDTPTAKNYATVDNTLMHEESKSLGEEEVILRREKVTRVGADIPIRDDVESMIIHDIETKLDSLIVDNVDISQEEEVNGIDESKLKDEITALTSENGAMFAEEKSEHLIPVENVTNESKFEHCKIGLDEIEVRNKRRLSSGNTEELERKAYPDLFAGISRENVTENENSDVFNGNIEEINVNQMSENVETLNTDNGTLEKAKEINKEELQMSNKEVFFSRRATEFMVMLNSEVLDLIYWKDVKKTGVVFGSMMFVLLSLTFFTILSVLAYLSLAVLTVTLSFRVYKNVMQAVQKTSDGHPFKKILALDIALQSEVVETAADKIATNINNCSNELRRLFLVEDYVDTLKFGLLLWLLTYVGSWFNGMTLVILAVVCIFTLPKVYETYQGPIDQNVNLVRTQLNNILKQVSSKIPLPKKKAKQQ